MGGVAEVPNTGSRHSLYPKYQITLGPWARGLNSSNDKTLISSDELHECVNFVIREDGRLRIRPQAVRQYPDPSFWDLDFTLTRIQGLGSIRLGTDNIAPLVALFTLPPSFGGSGKITFWRYSETGPTIPATPAWNESFQEIDWPYTTDDIWFTPIQCLVYNKKYFVLFNRDGYATAGAIDDALSTTSLRGPINVTPPGGGDPPPDNSFLRKMVILKDRIIIHSDEDVYWSTTNPDGSSTDWSETAPNTAGNLGLDREITRDRVHDIIVYQNELYILGSTTVSKLSWNDDPGVDGEFVVVSSMLGGQTFAVVNGDLYVFNGFGLYRLVTSYFVEVSEPVRDFIRSSCKGQPESLPNGTFQGWDERPVVGMYHLDGLLLIGPLNGEAAQRYDDVEGTYSCNVYLVWNTDSETWSKWQFNPNGSDAYPVAGPSQMEIMKQAINDPAFTDSYLWVGRTLVNGTTVGDGIYGQAIYTMDAVANLMVDNTIPVGYDDAGPVSADDATRVLRPIGLILETASIDLGDSDTWKRVQTATLDAKSFTIPSITHGEAPKMGYVLDNPTVDGEDRIIDVPTKTMDRLQFGGAYRCHRFGLFYDSLTSVATSAANPADIDLVKKASIYITLSRKDVAGRT